MRMFKLIAITGFLLIFNGCSQSDSIMAAGQKAGLVSELIIDNARCASFKGQLATGGLSDEAVDKVYQDAMKANCVNKDI